MTISNGERQAAVTRALRRLAELCGDESNLWFGEVDLAEAMPLRTTIAELQALNLIEQKVMSSNPEPFVLTAEGWFQAQRASGRFDSIEFRARQGRLCAALKRRVDGRRDEELVGWRELALDANVPDGWLWNILEGDVLFRLHRRNRYSLKFDRGIVFVPPTFGTDPVGLE